MQGEDRLFVCTVILQLLGPEKRTFEHRIKGSEDANSDTVWTNNVTDFSKY